MATTRALAADAEVITNTETYVSSALAFGVQAILPKINAGATSTVGVGTQIQVETTAAGPVELLTFDKLRRVVTLPARSRVVLVAKEGTAQSVDDAWTVQSLVHAPVAFVAASVAPSGGSVIDVEGRAATALVILENAAMKSALIKFGFLKAQ